MHDQIGLGVAVGVVSQVLAELAQRSELRRIEAERCGERAGRAVEIVAKRRDDCPDALPALEIAVDEDPGADAGRGIDHRPQSRVPRHLAGEVVIEVLPRDATLEQRLQRRPIARHRDIEHGRAVARLCADAREQCDVALDAGDQHRLARLVEAELVQRAQPVGVAVEYVVMGHGR